MTEPIGGSVVDMSMRGRALFPTGDSDFGLTKGGKQNEVRPNGNGTARVIQTTVPWGAANVVVECDDLEGVHEFVQELADTGRMIDCTFTMASGLVWEGKGIPTGEITRQTEASTVSFAITGSGVLRQQ